MSHLSVAWFRDSAEKAPGLIQGEALRQGLLERLAEASAPRDGRGRYHPWRAVLGIIVLAKLAGTRLAQRPIAKLARRLTRRSGRQRVVGGLGPPPGQGRLPP